MKRGLIGFLALLTLAFAVMGALAETAAGPATAAGSGRAPILQDEAGLLDESEEAALKEVMEPVCAYGTPVFWSTNQAGDYRRKAERKYKELLGNGSGLLFVIDMSERQLTVLTQGEILKVIRPSDATTITDNVYHLAGLGEYGACAEEVFRQARKLLEGEKIAQPMKIVSNILLALTLGLLLLWLRISYHYENKAKTGKKTAPLPVTASAAAIFSARITNGVTRMTKQTKTRIDSGGSHGGGGFSGGGFSGGGGGGGFSGGGGSHRF